MKKISYIPAMSVIASTALIIGIGLFSSPANAVLSIYSCQTKKSCSGTTPIWTGDMDNMNKCAACSGYTGSSAVQGNCASGKICMGNGACVTKKDCSGTTPVYVATNNTCAACSGYTGSSAVQGTCPSGKICMGNGSCVSKTSCSNTQVYVATNNSCRAPNSEYECQTLSGYGSAYHYIDGTCKTCGTKVWYSGACRQTCHYSSDCSTGTCHEY